MKLLFNAILLFLFCVPVFAEVTATEQVEQLKLINKQGEEIAYSVEIADEEEERRLGLMYRRHMPQENGMLFLYEKERQVGIWMKNTYLSLDIIFIDAHGKIVKLFENAQPLSTRVMSSGQIVKAVLELNAGQVAENNIAVGDKVMHHAFQQSEEK